MYLALAREILSNRAAAVGLAILVLTLGVAFFGHFRFPGDPWEMVATPMLWPGDDPANPLGTDLMGRDIATGLISGARVSLLIGLVSALISALVGITAGALGGFYRGRVDASLMRVTEICGAVGRIQLRNAVNSLTSVATSVKGSGAVCALNPRPANVSALRSAMSSRLRVVA